MERIDFRNCVLNGAWSFSGTKLRVEVVQMLLILRAQKFSMSVTKATRYTIANDRPKPSTTSLPGGRVLNYVDENPEGPESRLTCKHP